MIYAVLILAGLGLIAALGLGIASRVFAVATDPKVEAVLDLLPGANCGACGFAGCAGYADAVASGAAAAGLCTVNSQENNEAIAKVLGVAMEKLERKFPVLHCQGDKVRAVFRYEYHGVFTCAAAHLLAGGSKGCRYGCLGYGDCMRSCPFDAIRLDENGMPIFDNNKCTSCGACERACPRNIIELVPVSKKVHVLCMSKDKGARVQKYCALGCIACKKCEKNCPVDAIHVVDNIALIDYSKCINCGICASVCPSHSIIDNIGERPRYEITECIGCTLCAKKCPVGAITGEKKQMHVIDQEKCVHCGICDDVCKKGTITKTYASKEEAKTASETSDKKPATPSQEARS